MPNTPHHVVQRGHNKQTVFKNEEDYRYYLEALDEWSYRLQVTIYAWCLMTNHVHLLLDPGDNVASIGLLMKRLAGRQTRYVNKRECRTGSLWDGRYKMSIVDKDRYFLLCCRYIELNPVKAGMVERAEQYRWSSYSENAGLSSPWLIDRRQFREISAIRFSDYSAFVAAGESITTSGFISERLECNGLTGDDRFVDEIESKTGVRLEYRQPGRPPIDETSG
ncbi:MAG: transposase [Pseudomonadota bacterium]